MDPRSSLSECQREQLVALFESGMGNRAAATSLGLTRNAVRRLEQRWKLHGRLCLVEKPTNQAYSFEVKKEVVDRFLAGETAMGRCQIVCVRGGVRHESSDTDVHD